MKKPVISVQRVTKSFVLTDTVRTEQNIRELFAFRRQPKHELARKVVLEDVSFDVFQSDRISVVGRNGAGKSTLLKIISRVLTPNSGRVESSGRIVSLLELGTGMSSELTGRDNIYFYGAIMGMKKKEVDKIYDEIVDFAGLGDYMDQPLKYYSSGMSQRLAFSAAFAIVPNILVADEGLSVGDLEFNEKSRKKLEELNRAGTTLLLVSHDLSTMSYLTERSIWLEDGKVKMDGETQTVLDAYTNAYSTV